MNLPELEKLHDESIKKMKLLRDGYGPKGLAALSDAASYFAIAKVCEAVRSDLRGLKTNLATDGN